MLDSHRIALPIGEAVVPLHDIINNSIPSFPEYGDLNNLHVLHRRSKAIWSLSQVGDENVSGDVVMEFSVRAEAATPEAAASLESLHCNLEDHEHNPYSTDKLGSSSEDDSASELQSVEDDMQRDSGSDEESVEDIDIPVRKVVPVVIDSPKSSSSRQGPTAEIITKLNPNVSDALTAVQPTEEALQLSLNGLTLKIVHVHFPDVSMQRRIDIRNALVSSQKAFPFIGFGSPIHEAMVIGLEVEPGGTPAEPPHAASGAYTSVFDNLCASQMQIQSLVEKGKHPTESQSGGSALPAIDEDEVLRLFVAHVLHVSHASKREEKKTGVVGTGPLEYFTLISKLVDIESTHPDDSENLAPIAFIKVELADNSLMVAFDPLKSTPVDAITDALASHAAKVDSVVDFGEARARVLEQLPGLLNDISLRFTAHLKNVCELQKEEEHMILEGVKTMEEMVEITVGLQHDYDQLAADATSGLASTSVINTVAASRVPKAIQLENDGLKNDLDAMTRNYNQAMSGQQALREETAVLKKRLHDMEVFVRSEKLRDVALRDEVETMKDYTEELKASWAVKYRHFDKYKVFYDENRKKVAAGKEAAESTPTKSSEQSTVTSPGPLNNDKRNATPVANDRVSSPSGRRVATAGSPTKRRDDLSVYSTLATGGTSLAPRKDKDAAAHGSGLHRSHAPDRVQKSHPVAVKQRSHPDRPNSTVPRSYADTAQEYRPHTAFSSPVKKLDPAELTASIDDFITKSYTKVSDVGNSSAGANGQKSYPVNPFHHAFGKPPSRSGTPQSKSNSRPNSGRPIAPVRPSSPVKSQTNRPMSPYPQMVTTADQASSSRRLLDSSTRPKLQLNRNMKV